MEYDYDDFQPGVQIIQQPARPGRNRHRQGSERARHHDGTYWAGETLLVPAGYPLQRSASTGGQRPTNIVIRNEVEAHNEARSRSRERPRSRHRSRSRYESESDSDSDWDDREHDKRRSRRHTTAASRSPSPYLDYKTKEKLDKLKDYEREKEREKQEEEIKQQMLVKKAKAELEATERKKKEDEIKKRAIEDYNREQAEKEAKAKKEKEEQDKAFEQKVKAKFLAAGYSEEDAERILKGKKEERKQLEYLDTTKTTYVKVHRKYLLPDTLDHYNLPWEWDERDGNYIVIKKWINKDLQDELFEHTRKYKERKLITYEPKKKDELFIVRKKSPAGARRKSWMFT